MNKKLFMKIDIRIVLLSLLFLSVSLDGKAQVITTAPALPIENDAVTLTFHADQGNKGLMDFTGDIYAHTGVITNKSTSGSDWKYVQAEWNENTTRLKLTRIEPNTYKLSLTPTLREFYNVAEGETIEQLAFVFRNSDGSKTGRNANGGDIFVDVFQEGLNVSFNKPSNNFSIILPNTSIAVEIVATGNDEIKLYLDNSLIKTVSGNLLEHSLAAQPAGTHEIVAVASNAEESISDTAWFLVHATPESEPMPAGTKAGINYLDQTSVILSLYAPGKDFVYLLSSLNNYTPDDSWQLEKDGDYFWIQIDNLTSGKEYTYQYLVDGEIRIGDPYADKVLDPSNDKYIEESTYPNLIPYPEGKTTGIVSVFEPGQAHYQWQNTDFIPPEPENLIIYELLLRDFIAAHDWETLTDTLHYFTELGVNAIELMPFNEFEGNESWGYNPSYYFAPDKYYGPKEDLKAFIDSCHGRGIAVIMDMVLNHSYSQSPLVQLYFDPQAGDWGQVTEENPWYNVTSPNTAFSWGYDFDHESQATKDFVDRVNAYWLTEYNIDGYRFDFTKGFTNTLGDGSAYDAARIAILKRMSDEIWEVDPDAYVILEHFAANDEEIELSDYGMLIWGNMNCPYNQATMGFASGPCAWNFSGISHEARGWNNPYLVGYMESHDEERLMYKNLTYGNESGDYSIQDKITAMRRVEQAAAFFFPVPGPKMIWQFGEMGYDVSIDYNGRVGNKPIRWVYYRSNNRLREAFGDLIDFRLEHSEIINNGDFSIDASGAAKHIAIDHQDMNIRIIGNFDVKSADVSGNFSQTGWWYSYFGGDSINVTDLNMTFEMEPGEYRIFTTKNVSIPELPLKTPFNRNAYDVKVFPNPVENHVTVESPQKINRVNIFDISGRNVMVYEMSASGNQTFDLKTLPAGTYMLQIIPADDNHPTRYKKVLKR
jgi:glycosidase